MACRGLQQLALTMMLALLLGAHDASAAFHFTHTTNATVSVAGVLTLDSTAPALYADALLALPPAAASSDLSFTTFFTFSTSTGGVLAFLITPDSDLPVRYPSLLAAATPDASSSASPLDVQVIQSNATSASGLLLPIYDVAFTVNTSSSGNQAVEYEVSFQYEGARNDSITTIQQINRAGMLLGIDHFMLNNTLDLSPLLRITTNSSYQVGLLCTGGGVFNVSLWNFTTQGVSTHIVQALDAARPASLQSPNSTASPGNAASPLPLSCLRLVHSIMFSLATGYIVCVVQSENLYIHN